MTKQRGIVVTYLYLIRSTLGKVVHGISGESEHAAKNIALKKWVMSGEKAIFEEDIKVLYTSPENVIVENLTSGIRWYVKDSSVSS